LRMAAFTQSTTNHGFTASGSRGNKSQSYLQPLPATTGAIIITIAMTLGVTLVEVWRQVLVGERPWVDLEGRKYRVGTTQSKRLRAVDFDYESLRLSGIEQNPDTSSNWAEQARPGKQVMQFTYQRRYVANVCEGKLLRYPAWRSLNLPD